MHYSRGIINRFDDLNTKYSAALEEISVQERDEESNVFIPCTLTQYGVPKGLRIFGKEAEKVTIE